MSVDSTLPKVLVLLSTHNGSRWLDEFLESLVSQIGVDLSIIVRDDGSGDDTLNILRSFRGKLKIEIVSGKNIGSFESYLELIKCASNFDFDYFSFADQDDVWHTKKTITAIERLLDTQKQVYGSRRIPFSEEGKRVGKPYPKKNVVTSFSLSLFENFLPACTIVGTRDFYLWLRNIPIPGSMLYIDMAICSLACSANTLYMDQDSFIDYRIHSSNTVGINRGLGKIRRLRIKSYHSRIDALTWLAENQYNQIAINDALLVKKILYQKGIFKRIKILRSCGDIRQSKLESFLLKTHLIFRVPVSTV